MIVIGELAIIAFVLRRLWVFVVGLIAAWQLNHLADEFRAPY